MELPPAVAAAVARGLAAFLRQAPAGDIPPNLRRLAGFRDQALKPHRAKLLAALDDDDFRSKVLDWLDDAPAVKGDEARLLEIAARRDEGWEQALIAAAPAEVAERDRDDARLRSELKKERARVSKLKEDLRRQKEEGRGALADALRSVSELRTETRDLRELLGERERELAEVRDELAKAARDAEKDKRALRRSTDRAVAARTKAEGRATELRRAVAALERRVHELEVALDKERARAERAQRSISRRREPEARRPLDVPKGLLADAPETLRAWLDHDAVALVVDGYNVGKAERGFPDLELEAMRNRVVDEVAKLTRRFGIEAIVVFDGADVAPGTGRRRRGNVRIDYSRPGETADDHIVALLETLAPTPVVVATNDRELQDRVRRLAATVATSDQLLALIRRPKPVAGDL